MSVPRLTREGNQLDNGLFNPYPFVGVNRAHGEAHLTCYHSTGELPVMGVLGDDMKSQVGATIVHRVLTKLFEDRGQPIKRSYQLNVGGNTDFLTMLDRTRLESKRRSKTQSVLSQMNGMERAAEKVICFPTVKKRSLVGRSVSQGREREITVSVMDRSSFPGGIFRLSPSR